MQSDDRSIPELRAPDQNRVLGGLADFTRILEKELGPLDLFLPVSSEFLEKASYGDPFFRMAPSGTGSRIPMTADKDYLFEGALLSALAPMARPGRKAARAARGKRPMSEQEALSQFLDTYERRNPVQNFAVGGGARKVKDLLADVLLGKSQAAPTKDKPDPRRRRAVGLPKDITPKPGEMVVKEEVKQAPKTGETSVSFTEALNLPMSRRDVLRAGAGQAMSAMAPRGALGALAKAAASPTGFVGQMAEDTIKEALTTPARGAASGVATLQGAIARALREGAEDEEIVEQLRELFPSKFPNEVDEDELLDYIIPNMRDPYDVVNPGSQTVAEGPLEYLNRSLGYPASNELRPVLREIRETDPLLYNQLFEAARDTDMTVAEMTPGMTFKKRLEAAQAMAEKGGYPFDMQKFMQRYGYPEDFNPN